jgi:phosphopantetheinyl transferase
LTHCDDLAAAVAFNDMFLLGIDIEKVNRNINHGAESELTNYEKELANNIPYSYENSILALWTMKESLSKVLKTGLTVPFNILEVKNIQICNDGLISTFTNFPQYCSISFKIYNYICSIVYPSNVEIDIDINKIRQNLYRILEIPTSLEF